MPLRRKLLKTSDTKERSVHTNLESCNIQIGSEKNSIYCKTNYSDITTYIIIISFTYSYIVDISSYFLLVSYAIILLRSIIWPLGVSAIDAFYGPRGRDSGQRHLATKNSRLKYVHRC